MANETSEVPLCTLEVYHLDDILNVFTAEFQDAFMEELSNSDISFGDAAYTLVSGSTIDRMLHDLFDGDDWDGCLSKSETWSKLPVLFNPDVLVAIRG
jgi:hypothetical protein